MRKCFVAMATAAAMLAVALPSGASAGASSSAPSKYSNHARSDQLRAGRQNFPITEYSSSARRTNRH